MEKTKKCTYCGELFYYERRSAIYCSDACKQQAYLERRAKFFLNINDAEDVEIESCSDQPMNEIVENTVYEETVSEAEVLNQSESAETIKSYSNSKKRKQRKSHVPSSGNEADSKSIANSNANGLFALLGAAALGYLIREFNSTSNVSEEINSDEESTESYEALEPTEDHEIKESTKMSGDVSDSIPNKSKNTEPFVSLDSVIDSKTKSGNIFVRIFKHLNILWKKLKHIPNTMQDIENSESLRQDDMESFQFSTFDSPIVTEINNEKEVEQPLENDSIPKVLGEYIRRIENNKIVKDINTLNPENNDLL